MKGNGLAKIVAEEEHDAADFQHDRDKIQDAKDHIGRTLLTLALLALAPAIAAIFLLWLFFGRERKTDYDREYEQSRRPRRRPRSSLRSSARARTRARSSSRRRCSI